jgi:serine phosphatase RsbU (regulator of sigma subunit)
VLAGLSPNAGLLGVGAGVPIGEDTFAFGEADRLVLYTDGIIEVLDGEKEHYGWRRLRRLISSSVDVDPPALVDMIFDEVDEHARSESPQDDQSVIVIDFLSRKSSPSAR